MKIIKIELNKLPAIFMNLFYMMILGVACVFCLSIELHFSFYDPLLSIGSFDKDLSFLLIILFLSLSIVFLSFYKYFDIKLKQQQKNKMKEVKKYG